MKQFMDEHFLLTNTTAQKLFHEFAKHQPIYDYHCHLSPADIANDRVFNSIGELWLEGDHYKWRLMRAAGVPETLITGNADIKDKYLAWASVVPKCIGNPAYHWVHLELQKPFGIDHLVFSPDTAEEVWAITSEKLKASEFSARGLLQQMNVAMVGTTDDPSDSLEHHRKIHQDNMLVTVAPSFRPDKIFKIDRHDYKDYIHVLEKVSGQDIHSMDTLFAALNQRLDVFSALGCLASDHGIEVLRFAALPHERDLDQILLKALTNKKISEQEQAQFFTAVILWLAEQYEQRGWAMQLHIGPLRNTSTRMLKSFGPDAGCDSMGDRPFAYELAKLLNAMDVMGRLPKTILYHINPAANEVLASMVGNFQGGGIPGKMQFGSAWWFNDQKDGMERQLEQLAQLGMLSQFIGMLTDSRSFLSYSRHEYFRRILCNKLGMWVESGEAPNDIPLLGAMVQDICYHNAKRYFATANA
ncbi:Uronate isomerase [Thalassocella blandensis]|nr:Uronate isomerase [Thalassocella blandensis]